MASVITKDTDGKYRKFFPSVLFGMPIRDDVSARNILKILFPVETHETVLLAAESDLLAVVERVHAVARVYTFD